MIRFFVLLLVLTLSGCGMKAGTHLSAKVDSHPSQPDYFDREFEKQVFESCIKINPQDNNSNLVNILTQCHQIAKEMATHPPVNKELEIKK